MNKIFKFINDIALYIVVFTIVYENWDPLGSGGTQSIAYLATLGYVASWFPLFGTNLKLSVIKRFAIPLFFFVIVGIVSTALNSGYATTVVDLLKTRFYLLIILTFLIANHIIADKTIIWRVLLVYIISVSLMNILVLMGYGISFELGRINIFGENPNSVGAKAAVAFIIVLTYLYNSKKPLFIKLPLCLVFMIGCLNLILLSASRGALLALFLGTLIVTILKKMSVIKKVVFIVIGLAFVGFFFQYILENNAVFTQRISNSLDQGDIGRNALWEIALKVIEDNLFIGVGVPTSAFLTEMYRYGGGFIGPHNIFLYILMTTGIIGFFFFVSFLIRLFVDLYKSYHISGNSLFLAIFVLILLFASKEGGAIGSIYSWFFFAVLIGSTFLTDDQQFGKVGSSS